MIDSNQSDVLLDISVWEIVLLAFGLVLTLLMAAFIGIVLYRSSRDE